MTDTYDHEKEIEYARKELELLEQLHEATNILLGRTYGFPTSLWVTLWRGQRVTEINEAINRHRESKPNVHLPEDWVKRVEEGEGKCDL